MQISYVAVRGQSAEAGAVQRVLNQRRISNIREFTLRGGDYPGAIVLNWTDASNPLEQKNGNLTFKIKRDSAQIVDGQHRVAGIQAAILSQPNIGQLELCVAIYEELNTQECADIFLSINTEQKPVDRSLVFDLYGIASEGIIDQAAVRARDIALFLHSTDDSPYRGLIKLPGDARRKGGIALSTVVTAIKPLVTEKGNFEQLGVKELEGQKQIMLNLFQTLQKKYGSAWNEPDNVFLYAAGFVGAIEFFKQKLIPYCNNQRSFEQHTLARAIALQKNSLLLQSQVKGLAGSEATNKVFSQLVEAFSPETTHEKIRI